jgi:ABC-type nitrate/sulfonate/bicarbonate transport system substrate-binding protein
MESFLKALRKVIKEIKKEPDEAAEIWARFADQPVDMTRDSLDRMALVGDMNDQIRADIVAFFEQAAKEGHIQETPSEDIFYTNHN